MSDICERCQGDGTIDVPGTSLNPYTAMRVIDPQEERTVECPDCRGEGVTHV